MASGYAPVEADDVLFDAERGGQETLQFKNFDTTSGAGTGYTNNGSTTNRGYSLDQPQGRGGFWSLDYYQQYFDVDTNTVLKRCYTTLIPTTSNYVSTHLTPQPDLYGPFWTLTTLIFCLFVFSSLASSIAAYFSTSNPDAAETMVYNVGLLSIAVSLVYAYGIGVPVLIWGALRWLGEQEWSLIEAVAVWGYGQFVWIPVSALCVIPVPIVRWVLVGVACGLSGFFLFTNVYPVLSSTDSKVPRFMVIILAILHLALALVFKVLFFSYYVVNEIGPKDPIGETPSTDLPADGASNTTTAAAAAMVMLKMFRW